MTIDVLVNGKKKSIEQGNSIEELLAELKPQLPYSVAINTVFVPRDSYAQTILNDGDKVDIVSPVFGG